MPRCQLDLAQAPPPFSVAVQRFILGEIQSGVLENQPPPLPSPSGGGSKTNNRPDGICIWRLPLPPLGEGWDGGWLLHHNTLNQTPKRSTHWLMRGLLYTPMLTAQTIAVCALCIRGIGLFDHKNAAARSGLDVVAVAQMLLELSYHGQCIHDACRAHPACPGYPPTAET